MSFDPKCLEGPFDAGNGRKKPTFLQWLKSCNAKQLGTWYTVQVIWFPGEWNNYTLETDEFRIRVPSTDPLYRAMVDFVNDQSTANVQLDIKASSRNSRSFLIRPKETKGLWSLISDSGMRWEP